MAARVLNTRAKNVGDFACGVGGRVFALSKFGIKQSIRFYDIIKEQLVEVSNKVSRLKAFGRLKIFYKALDLTKKKQSEDEIKSLEGGDNKYPEKMNFVIMYYAIHFMLHSKEDFDVFINFLNKSTTDDVIFVANIIDIGKALDFVNGGNKSIGIPTRYSITQTEKSVNLKNPIGNIMKVSLIYKSDDNDDLRTSTEPVIESGVFIKLMEGNGWNLVDRPNASKIVDVRLDNNEDIEWSKCHEYCAFKKQPLLFGNSKNIQ